MPMYSSLSYAQRVGFLACLGGMATMLSYLCVSYCMLPLTDEARQAPLIFSILDPFVLTVASFAGALAVAVVYPFAYFCLRNRRLGLSTVLVTSLSVIGVIALTIATRDDLELVLGGATLLTICSLLLCRLLPLPFLRQPPSESSEVGRLPTEMP